MNTPRRLANPDWTRLLEIIVENTKQIAEEARQGDYCDDNDSKHYIYEAAIEAVYGENYWKWLNKIVG
jgi:hypothetical protein